MPQVFCCSNTGRLKGVAYLVLRVFVVRMTRRENIYKADAWGEKCPPQWSKNVKKPHNWVLIRFSSCLLIRPLRLRTILRMSKWLTYFTSNVREGWLMALLSASEPLRGSCPEFLFRWGWQTGLKEASQGLWLFWGNTRVWSWNYESMQTLAWSFQGPKTHWAEPQLLSLSGVTCLSCWDAMVVGSEVCLDWTVHPSNCRTYWVLMLWWREWAGAALGSPAGSGRITSTVSNGHALLLSNNNKEGIVLWYFGGSALALKLHFTNLMMCERTIHYHNHTWKTAQRLFTELPQTFVNVKTSMPLANGSKHLR